MPPADSPLADDPPDAAAWERTRLDLEAELGDPITVDGLTASWRIFQRKRGHRHSVDDLLTGWYALESYGDMAPPLRALDLGTGIGTVGLLVLSGLPQGGSLVAIEAQEQSFRLLRANVERNNLTSRVEMHLGDLRDFAPLASGERFALVTGSPPYFDVTSGKVPADSQKAHARFELRGDVGDYLHAARRHLAPGGRFVFCFPYAQRARAVAAVQKENFTIVRAVDVIPRAGLTPLISLFVTELAAPDSPPFSGAPTDPPFVVRTKDGTHTDAMHAVRARFGWPPNTRPA